MTARWNVVAVSITAALVVAGCTGSDPKDPTTPPTVLVGVGELRLASFDSCEQALGDLQKAMLPLVGPYGLFGGGGRGGDLAQADAAAEAAPAPAAPGASGAERGTAQAESKAADSQHSGTNTHEAGVDEPDLVKTDGKRIVTVIDGTLRVVDAATRKQVATMPLPEPRGADDLMLSGDHALVIRHGGHFIHDGPARELAPPRPGGAAAGEPGGGATGEPGEPVQPSAPDEPGKPIEPPFRGAELLLVDLTGTPKVLATFGIDGRFVDARMVGQTVRVVAHSQPRMEFVYPTPDRDEKESQRLNREIVSKSKLDSWLPRYRLQQDGAVSSGRVDCSAVTRPANYSATSMLTVLSFDLSKSELGTGDPVTIVADGEVVYGTAGSLYVASYTGWATILRGGPDLMPAPRGGPEPVPAPAPQERTELYKFDTSGPGKPRHVASGAVPGNLLNQYSMSEYDGHLRVATTVQGGQISDGQTSESTVYAMAQRGDRLTVAGQVGGLGKGERIYAVRFAGPLGYVVTFRQTDPLYTLDLRNPAAPKVTGELKITGYSAYLHPIGDGKLIGVGQEASEEGRVQGTQVSLFDVSDPAAPQRVAQYHVPQSSSEAESDPHAFLYWPATRTLVLPIMNYDGNGGAIVLRVGDGEFTEVGQLRQPAGPGWSQPIRRSLVVDDTLWTLSELGLAANGLGTLDARGWVPFGV